MTEQEQQIAIAEACGWTKIDWYEDNSGPGFWHGIPPVKLNANWEVVDQNSDKLPDFPKDLNAMHEAERTLTDEQADELFYYWLAYAVSQGKCGDQIWQYRKLMVHATATQRAEAFLRTIGKWKD